MLKEPEMPVLAQAHSRCQHWQAGVGVRAALGRADEVVESALLVDRGTASHAAAHAVQRHIYFPTGIAVLAASDASSGQPVHRPTRPSELAT